MKTPQDVNKLKSNWYSDPCWDIEDTPGFEVYHEELLQYRLETEAMWNAQYEFELQQEAERLGVPGAIDLLLRIRKLEREVKELTDRIGVLQALATR